MYSYGVQDSPPEWIHERTDSDRRCVRNNHEIMSLRDRRLQATAWNIV